MSKTELGGTKLRNAAHVRRKAFAEHVAAGKTWTEAARLAGYTGTTGSIRNTASKLMTKGDVQEMVRQATEKASSKRILTVIERKELLTQWIQQDAEPTEMKDRIAALKELNAMEGLHVKQLQHSGPGGAPIAGVMSTLSIDELRSIIELAKARRAGLTPPTKETP
jgi:phage terminase small subunit